MRVTDTGRILAAGAAAGGPSSAAPPTAAATAAAGQLFAQTDAGPGPAAAASGKRPELRISATGAPLDTTPGGPATPGSAASGAHHADRTLALALALTPTPIPTPTPTPTPTPILTLTRQVVAAQLRQSRQLEQSW